jgi:hypothetical protein
MTEESHDGSRVALKRRIIRVSNRFREKDLPERKPL